MVSEPFVSSAESVMTNESNDEVFVLKFAPRLGFQLSNLKDIIDEHFNLPHVQVRCGKNGGVVLTGLFDGIPDDVESQDHESFDEINKLLGWIEGCIELPERSKSVAPKLFDESLRAMEESSDQHVHDEFEVTLANSDQISHKEVPLDEIPTCDVTNDDDMLIDEDLNVDNTVKGDEEIVQIELNDELILMKEFSDLLAHQVFDEMPRVMASHEINFDGPKLSGVALLGAVVNQPNRLHSKFDHDKVYPKLHKSVLETYVNSVACLELHYFDPGGKGFRLSGSLISNESELVDELVDDEYDHKAMHVGSVSDQDDLKVFDMNDVKDAKPLLLAKSELTGLFKMPNKLTTQGRMMNGPIESLIFDPGGVKVACVHCAAQVLIGICADFCFHFGADSNGDQAENFTDACFIMRPFEPGVFQVMKGRPIMNAFDVNVIASTIHSKGLHVKVLNEGKLGILDHKVLLVDSTEEQDGLKAHKVSKFVDYVGFLMSSIIKEATPLLLISEFIDASKVQNALPAQEEIPTDYKGILCFDFVGVKSACVQCVTHLLAAMCVDLCCHFGALTGVGNYASADRIIFIDKAKLYLGDGGASTEIMATLEVYESRTFTPIAEISVLKPKLLTDTKESREIEIFYPGGVVASVCFMMHATRRTRREISTLQVEEMKLIDKIKNVLKDLEILLRACTEMMPFDPGGNVAFGMTHSW